MRYLQVVYNFANTASLYKEMELVDDDFEVGDVVIRPGNPGHAVIIVDKVCNEGDGYLFTVAHSMRPAQDIEIVQPSILHDRYAAPWPWCYAESSLVGDTITFGDFTFSKDVHRRFPYR